MVHDKIIPEMIGDQGYVVRRGQEKMWEKFKNYEQKATLKVFKRHIIISHNENLMYLYLQNRDRYLIMVSETSDLPIGLSISHMTNVWIFIMEQLMNSVDFNYFLWKHF